MKTWYFNKFLTTYAVILTKSYATCRLQIDSVYYVVKYVHLEIHLQISIHLSGHKHAGLKGIAYNSSYLIPEWIIIKLHNHLIHVLLITLKEQCQLSTVVCFLDAVVGQSVLVLFVDVFCRQFSLKQAGKVCHIA